MAPLGHWMAVFVRYMVAAHRVREAHRIGIDVGESIPSSIQPKWVWLRVATGAGIQGPVPVVVQARLWDYRYCRVTPFEFRVDRSWAHLGREHQRNPYP